MSNVDRGLPGATRPASRLSTGHWTVTLPTIGLLLVGSLIYWQILRIDGRINIVEWISLPLFVILFGWISFSFSLASLGFVMTLRRWGQTKQLQLSDTVAGPDLPGSDRPDSVHSHPMRTAVLMPVYNESPKDVFAGVLAMMKSTFETGRANDFDFFILSDSTKPEIRSEESRLWKMATEFLKESYGLNEKQCQLYYRHREKNIARKSGNIANFCEYWGSHYEFMIVLDADSLLTGPTMVHMHDRMSRDPKLGILQVSPVPIGRNSLFARIQQFSADVYGPIYVQGFAAWSGSQGNYFGHNAILRIDGFKRFCALPILPGKEPLGGEILSHDFVEAALMLRGGYKVEIATDLEGSYEECPTTISDFAKRDQRWCQGNLQHSRLLVSDGFKPFSRLHFLTGILSYCSAPLWILFLVVTLLAATSQADAQQLTWDWSRPWLLFVVSMGMLLAPKFYGTLVASFSPVRRNVREQIGLWISVFFEIFFSILVAPIMAILHSRFVAAVLLGRSIQWKPQQRCERGVSWSEAFRDYGSISLAGVVATVLMAWLTPTLLFWFSPFLLGMMLAIPLVVAAGSESWGRRLRHWRILNSSAEISTPRIAVDRDQAARTAFVPSEDRKSNSLASAL